MTIVQSQRAMGAHAPTPSVHPQDGPADLDVISLFDLDIVNATTEDALNAMLDSPAPQRIAFVNAHCVNTASGDEVYRQALEQADMILPDGAGLSLAAKMNGEQIVENLNGTDLFPNLCMAAAARNMSIYLLGGAPGRAEQAAFAARRFAPGIRIVGARDGYFDVSDCDDVIDAVNASGADILLVGMGVPRQDIWLADNSTRLTPHVTLGVGGLFDYYSGAIPRAPRWMRSVGMEWAWRLAQEPSRLAKRYLIGNFTFMAQAARWAASQKFGREQTYWLTKRALDVTGAMFGLIALSPFFLALGLAIRLESSGPVLFPQVRVGRGGKTFKLYKFRSMYRDSEERRQALLATSERKGVCFKMKDDPRVTRIGRFIRKTSIDELPQLINVLRGEMSLVGPRPALESEVERYDDRDLERLTAIPGLTGIWQISGRADISFKRMIEMDIAYSKSRSILLDIAILAMTAPALLTRRGAY